MPTLYHIDHTSQHKSLPDEDRSYLPCSARISFRRPQIHQPENQHPDRPGLSCLPCTYPEPRSLCSTREPTSNSTKTNQPTLDPLHLTSSLAGPRIDPRIDQDRAAYPVPSSTQPHTLVPDSTESNSTKSNSTTLHRPSGDDTSKIPQPLQVSRNPENPLGKSRRRTAYPQQIVTTRLLYCLQDRFAQLSRLQRI